MILVVSKADDVHAATVLKELERLGAAATLLDLSEFPQKMGLALGYEGEAGRRFNLHTENHGTIDLAAYKAVWWRRPQQFRLHPEIMQAEHLSFAYTESNEAFWGLWQSLDAFWVNHPTKDEVAGRKVFQLRVAQDVGLAIPATLVTNDPDEARAFIDGRGHDRTIYKAFSATEAYWRETRLLKPNEVNLLDSVRYAPVIFQEYIPARFDIRITVVGDAIFPAAIYSQETSYKVDFRMDMARTRIEPVRLPAEIEAGLHALMARLGLIYGAIDMRLTPEGRYVFLEINPAGQWMFVEERSGQPITASLAHLLATHAC